MNSFMRRLDAPKGRHPFPSVDEKKSPRARSKASRHLARMQYVTPPSTRYVGARIRRLFYSHEQLALDG